MTQKAISELQSGWEGAYQSHGDSPLWQEAPIPVLDPAIKMMQAKSARTVIDVGCGDGRNLAVLVDAGFLCAGLDIAPTGLARAKDQIRNQCFYIHSDATKIPLIDNSVDVVTCLDVFGQVADPSELIAEIGRILIPGGMLIANAFTLEDETYGEGDKIGENMFAYKDTLFRYYTEQDMLDLFANWNVEKIERMSWDDPPHGEFRPKPHRHDNWVVYATPK